jgi:hypothetical protein
VLLFGQFLCRTLGDRSCRQSSKKKLQNVAGFSKTGDDAPTMKTELLSFLYSPWNLIQNVVWFTVTGKELMILTTFTSLGM